MIITELYKTYIYKRYLELLNSGIQPSDLNNNDLWKIFEWFSCIKLSEEYKTMFYHYDDIDSEFKENNKPCTKNDYKTY